MYAPMGIKGLDRSWGFSTIDQATSQAFPGFTLPSAGYKGLAIEGTNVWTLYSGTKLQKFSSTGTLLASYDLPLNIGWMSGFDFSYWGGYLWVPNGNSLVFKINPANGAIEETYSFGFYISALEWVGTNTFWALSNGGGTTACKVQF
jgi:hypothetical protein